MAVSAKESTLIRVKMAGIGFGQAPDELETLLGSCVGIAIWERKSKLGALAHIVLPKSSGPQSSPGKFADTAISDMKQKLIARGANPRRLTAKIAGGAAMFGPDTKQDIGNKNCEAVLEYLRQAEITVIAQHLRGRQGRQVRFSTSDGSLAVSIAREQVAVI